MNGNAPLTENQYVKELFTILNDNGKDATGLSALLGHVNEMENFVKRAEDKIAEMKSQLAEIEEVRNHPLKNALKKAIKSLESKVATIKNQLSEIKSGIIEGCKNAVAAFKDNGITALDKLASFFKVRQGLQGLKSSIDNAVAVNDKAVVKIDKLASEYHSAGRAIKNMARVAVGKEPISAKKEAGRLAKVFAAPYKVQKAVLIKMKKSASKMISRIERLETIAVIKKGERLSAKMPSFIEKLEAAKVKVANEKRDLPTPPRSKTQGLEV